MLLSASTGTIKVGARDSVLSQAQVKEVLELLREYKPKIKFHCTWMDSPGDRDQTQSLRELAKTDFFTRDLDRAVLSGQIQVAIHSAKDLPDPLPEGISIVAITRCLDPRDMIVPKQCYQRGVLPQRPIIGSSSKQRDLAVKRQYPDAILKDLRGTVLERLDKLDHGEYDAIVVPECALLRLRIGDRFRLPLHSTTASTQGQLAVTARSSDEEMSQLFSRLDTRRSS